MDIEPLNRTNFRGATIRRTGGIAGVDDQIRIHDDMRATVTCTRHGEHTVLLDETTAQELLHAFTRVAQERPAASTAKGNDFLHYDIELEWNGSVIRVASADVGADDALHGVMFVANRIASGSAAQDRASRPAAVHITGFDERAEIARDIGWPPPFSNDGIVPSWMQTEDGVPPVAPVTH